MSRLVVGATWDDAPHMSDEAKAKRWASIPAFARDARTKGIPQLGAGAIYPFPETDIRVDDFPIPSHYPRCFGLDVALGGTTSMVWAAIDRETQTTYVYSIYKRAQAETVIHFRAIEARGKWIPGAGDAADIVDADRQQFLTVYRKLGADLELADKAVETGIQGVHDLLSEGKLKVFKSCVAWFDEFRVYRRNERGVIVKVNDHLMDATRYLVKTGLRRAKVKPKQDLDRIKMLTYDEGATNQGWMS